MDLSWWKCDPRIDEEHYISLVLHLERESFWKKDMEMIEKLFSETEEGYLPENVIGIQYVDSQERIDFLNNLVLEKNSVQQSQVLMIYRYYDNLKEEERVLAYYFTPEGKIELRNAICKQDEFGYWFMCFEEEIKTA
ncbi:hypothetical protein [Bacillus salacetis]|uniref:hypothetical protein n=1 Tax=Bacillus salacetis TaxID=2315464 RepID=UPI001F0BDBC5|nr:hypothetical protein [Bacillus salacetis]